MQKIADLINLNACKHVHQETASQAKVALGLPEGLRTHRLSSRFLPLGPTNITITRRRFPTHTRVRLVLTAHNHLTGEKYEEADARNFPDHAEGEKAFAEQLLKWNEVAES